MENQNSSNQSSAKSNKTKWILLGLGLLTTGVVTVFSIQKQKKVKKDNPGSKTPSAPSTPSAAPGAKPSANLKDSINALFKTLNPKNKNAATSTAKTGAAKTNDPGKHTAIKKLAHTLHKAASEKNFKKVSDLLKTIKTPADYTSVNKVFSLSGLRPSIVSKLESTFTTEDQKQALKSAFTAIGLKYNGKKWSLAGIAEKPFLITTRPTQVWQNPETAVPVPVRMVLGKQIDQRGEFSVFENENQFFLVKTVDTKHYSKN